MPSEYIIHKKKLKGIRYMLLAIALINAAITVIFKIASSFIGDTIPMYIPAMIVGFFAYIIPIMIYAKINNITDKVAAKRFYLKKTDKYNMLLAAVLGIGCQFVMVIINLPLNLLFNAASSYLPKTTGELFLALIAIALIPAIFEEFLFRGIVFGSMAEFSTKAAFIFSVAMFTLLHADIYGFLGYIFLGIVLAWLVCYTDSLLPSVICHFSNNFTALLLGFFNHEINYAPDFTIVLFLIGVILFFVAFFIFKSRNKECLRVEKIKHTQLLGQSFVNLPILMCILATIIMGVIERVV